MATAHDDTFDLPDEISSPAKPKRKYTRRKAQAAGAAKIESDTEAAAYGRSGSMLNNLLSLGRDECFTRSIPFNGDITLRDMQDQLNDVKQRLRQSVNQAMFRATVHDGRALTMETNHTMTPSGKLYVQVIVTRTA